MTLFSINEDYLKIFNKWSQKSSKYNYQDVKSQWEWYKKSKIKKFIRNWIFNLLG